MVIFQRLYRRLKGQKKVTSQADVESLRIEFKTRYHAFKRLLAANQKVLDIMADMERKLSDGQSFGMSFVRASCTAASVNVLKMINHLDQLSHGKYPELKARFEDLQCEIENRLARSRKPETKRFVIDIKNVFNEMANLVGNKMANLGELKNNLHVQTPEGFVITAAAYEKFIQANDLQTEIDRRCQRADVEKMDHLHALSSELQQLIIRADVPEAILDPITRARERLVNNREDRVTLAFRSSALGEDSLDTTFAGQYRSVLNVGEASLLDAYKEVLASKYAIQAMIYRLNRGIRDEDLSMCVGCLEMVDASSGGVVYSRNPVDDSDDSIYINAAWGLPKSVVDGSDSIDLVVVSRKHPLSVVRTEIGDKMYKFVCFSEEGVRRVNLPDSFKEKPSITPEQALLLADLALRIEAYYKAPQDIEWAVTGEGLIHILQCRPLRQVKPTAEYSSQIRRTAGEKTIFADRGITASSGVAAGRVFLVNKHMDMLRFPQGAVLVTRQALPVWASLLNQASAVITEQGGFAGHLANVAREFGVPAIFGVSGATAELTNGDIVTVDADHRTIFRGKATSLPPRPVAAKAMMTDSPVYHTLQTISRHIVPLNLLDPDAPEFTPRQCKSLHDITRFVHEKSVLEMFNFGKSHDFSERSSKQLYYNVPMQWWVLNLDDGFKKEVRGKYVKLENICSIPMLAFWEGYTAVAWEGPPPVDGKGLMSVMFRSTMNPALSPGMRSKYADRNYFMISKNFCSLSSRLGYHFSNMEALLSERATENYVNFQFKGGAADYTRRHKRVFFVGELLEESGFRVEIKEDHLTARVEDYNQDFMLGRIKVLGYLALHTRQLDMIMSNGSAVGRYKTKIQRDLGELSNQSLSPGPL